MIRPVALLLAAVVLGAARSPLPPASPAHAPAATARAHVAGRHVAASRTMAGAARLPLPPAHVRAGREAVAEARPSLPLPPSPSARLQVLEGQPAPLPESDLPVPARDRDSRTLGVRIFSLNEQQGGLAFIPGSAYSAPEDRKPMQTPEVTLTLPLR